MLPALLAASLLAGCGGLDTPPPSGANPARIAADRQVPAGPLAGDRRHARHDAPDTALDEGRGQAIGSIVPPDSSPKEPPPPPPPVSQL